MTITNERYKDIIRAYYHHKDNEDCYFAGEAVAIVEIGTDGCSIFDTAEQCFEQSVKADIEESYSADDPFDFSIFTQDQLDFMLRAYPGTNLAAQTTGLDGDTL